MDGVGVKHGVMSARCWGIDGMGLDLPIGMAIGMPAGQARNIGACVVRAVAQKRASASIRSKCANTTLAARRTS